jgi:tetratricopeptide (TPR) repeat protein
MSNPQESLVQFLTKLAMNVFDRVIRGRIDFDKDMGELNRHRKQAIDLGDARLEARIVSIMATLCSYSGRFSQAIDLFWQARALYQQTEHSVGLATTLNNLAVEYDKIGQYEKAILQFNDGLALTLDDDQQLKAGFERIYGYLMSGKLGTLVSMANFEAAEACYLSLMSNSKRIVDHNQSEYGRVMVDVYRAMAEVKLDQKDLDAASSHLNLALEFSKNLGLTFEQVTLLFTQAHIMMVSGNESDAQSQWDAGEAILSQLEGPLQIARTYAEEARYLSRNGDDHRATYFATTAQKIFLQAEIQEGVQLVQPIIDKSATQL